MESKDSDGGSDAPNSRRGSRASSQSRGETTPDSSLSRPSSRNRYDLNLIPKHTPPNQPQLSPTSFAQPLALYAWFLRSIL
ncbi:hypothetical protein GCK72_003188 [Caenorhabditis remanei]|uniref:Uncharacterized protein n=1 Tax=Caenorhabditis remanei TaxID=31234 RepID=A0A6A5HYK7_CAERE|nr:hypothetical protein GCK72_003188 [Caenorhabditis remanei]KAF1771362.1 hypothetical protein GCK72_003188 [Caenorhabditis remanei]